MASSAHSSHALPKRGETYYKGKTAPTSFEVSSTHLEGTLQPFKDIDPTASAVGGKTYRSNRDVFCRLMRNITPRDSEANHQRPEHPPSI